MVAMTTTTCCVCAHVISRLFEAEVPCADFEQRMRRAAEEEALQASALRVSTFYPLSHFLCLQARIREDLLRDRLSDSELLIANMKHSCAPHITLIRIRALSPHVYS